MRSITALFIMVTFFYFVAIAAESPEHLIGIWEMNVTAKEGKSTAQHYKKVFAIQKMGDLLKVIDLEGTSGFSEAAYKGNEVKFSLKIPSESHESPMFSGTFKSKKLTGVTEIDGRPAKWEAAMLASVWACSNHNPIHTATSENEMRTLTTDKKCEGWRQLKSTNFSSAFTHR